VADRKRHRFMLTPRFGRWGFGVCKCACGLLRTWNNDEARYSYSIDGVVWAVMQRLDPCPGGDRG